MLEKKKNFLKIFILYLEIVKKLKYIPKLVFILKKKTRHSLFNLKSL